MYGPRSMDENSLCKALKIVYVKLNYQTLKLKSIKKPKNNLKAPWSGNFALVSQFRKNTNRLSVIVECNTTKYSIFISLLTSNKVIKYEWLN